MEKTTFKDYEYPLNLLIDIFGTKELPDYHTADFQEVLDKALCSIPAQVQTALGCRYKHQMTYDEIGAVLNVTGAWARQITVKGIILLKHPARSKLLRPDTASEVTNTLQAAPESDELPLGGMGLSVNPYNCLLRQGVRTASDILKLSPKELTQIKGMGQKSYTEVIDRLAALGYDVSAYANGADYKGKYGL